jgi:hypothetical protein
MVRAAQAGLENVGLRHTTKKELTSLKHTLELSSYDATIKKLLAVYSDRRG